MDREIEGPYYEELSPEEDERARAAIETAERQLSQEPRVNMRWHPGQLDVVKRAADLYGMPYQVYIRQAAFRAALDDLLKVQAATGGPKGEAA